MGKDTNPNGIGSDNNLKLKLKGVLQKNSSDNFSIVDATNVERQSLQYTLDVREMVCAKMHKAMSPISAISGYLELMKMLLEQDANSESLEQYRSKVKEGVSEIGEIIEELHEACDQLEHKADNSPIQSNNNCRN